MVILLKKKMHCLRSTSIQSICNPLLKGPKRTACRYLYRAITGSLVALSFPYHWSEMSSSSQSPWWVRKVSLVSSLLRNQVEFAVSLEIRILNKESLTLFPKFLSHSHWYDFILKTIHLNFQNTFWKFWKMKANQLRN